MVKNIIPKAQDKGDRLTLARHASYEIDAIAKILLRAVNTDKDHEVEIVAPAMLRRVMDLSSVIMSVTGNDDSRTTEEMSEVVHGDSEVAA